MTTNFAMYNFEKLNSIRTCKTAGRNSYTYANCIVTIDTETSKLQENELDNDGKYIPVLNYVCAWSMTILNCDTQEETTVWGWKPSQLVQAVMQLRQHIQAQTIFAWVHNLAYDWQFLRRFFIKEMCIDSQLNVKSHRPIMINFDNGLHLRDSLILAQRNLDKWSQDLDIEHKKAVGLWEYDKIRTQHENFTQDEITYFTYDTIALAECLYKTMQIFHKKVYSIPLTATGIPRKECYKRGKKNRARERFTTMYLSESLQHMAEKVYHGGYTHGNRYYINVTVKGEIECFDFSSSYPFVMLSEQYPMERFTPEVDQTIEEILSRKETDAFMFRLVAQNVRIKHDVVMPMLQFSKIVASAGVPELDNGRVLQLDYVEIYLTEIDLEVFYNQYDYDGAICTDVYQATKDYLPKWFTDYVFQCFYDKTQYKDGDPVLYMIAKGILNSLYGMCVQHPVQDNWMEKEDGEYYKEVVDYGEEYNKYINKITTILPYQWGIWVTAYAFRNLMKLGTMCKVWLYSDTDSVYGMEWDKKALKKYNDDCIEKLSQRGYTGVKCENNEKTYYLGIAALDGEYTEFKTLGAKRYCCRKKKDGELKITVAGVPKKGVSELNNDINNFNKGRVFRGSVTGKKMHTYLTHEINDQGIEYADSIDLTPADYCLDDVWVNEDYLYIESEVYETIYE